MRSLSFRTPEKYTREDCIRVIKEFHKTYGRVIKQGEVRSLSKKGQSPSYGIFRKYGGLDYLINESGLEQRKERIYNSVYDEPIRPIIKKELKGFISLHGRIPTYSDFPSNYFSVPISRIRREFGSLKNCLNHFGYSTKRPRK
jgi:hypothetical protein